MRSAQNYGNPECTSAKKQINTITITTITTTTITNTTTNIKSDYSDKVVTTMTSYALNEPEDRKPLIVALFHDNLPGLVSF